MIRNVQRSPAVPPPARWSASTPKRSGAPASATISSDQGVADAPTRDDADDRPEPRHEEHDVGDRAVDAVGADDEDDRERPDAGEEEAADRDRDHREHLRAHAEDVADGAPERQPRLVAAEDEPPVRVHVVGLLRRLHCDVVLRLTADLLRVAARAGRLGEPPDEVDEPDAEAAEHPEDAPPREHRRDRACEEEADPVADELAAVDQSERAAAHAGGKDVAGDRDQRGPCGPR